MWGERKSWVLRGEQESGVPRGAGAHSSGAQRGVSTGLQELGGQSRRQQQGWRAVQGLTHLTSQQP